MKLSVVIPVYNERDTLWELLRRVQAVALPGLEKEVVVVDDGSTDGTREMLQALVSARAGGAASYLPGGAEAPVPVGNLVVCFQQKGQGKGAALRRGFTEVTGDIVLVQDADLEYDPADYPALVAPIVAGKAEVVYGTRAPDFRGMRWPNRVFNHLAALLANLLYRAGISDEATCYKVFRTDVIRALSLRCLHFEFCPEVTAKVRKRGLRIHEVPIHYQARSLEAGKKIRWWDGLEAFWTLIKYRFKD